MERDRDKVRRRSFKGCGAGRKPSLDEGKQKLICQAFLQGYRAKNLAYEYKTSLTNIYKYKQKWKHLYT